MSHYITIDSDVMDAELFHRMLRYKNSKKDIFGMDYRSVPRTINIKYLSRQGILSRCNKEL